MKKNDNIELLAPAGNFESMKAAVANGADAVYLGGELFNARQGADNFTKDLLETALCYAAERGVRVYITLNTLTKDSEVDEALQFAGFVYEKGADAVIVQDIGLAGLLHHHLPELKLHASTQMTITNSMGIRQCEEMGISRVVLARELTLGEIEDLCRYSGIEIEVFVHGALCISYSGQCLMSSFIGSRSGNRGRCAQPCRLPWSIRLKDGSWSEESYLLSPKDLMGLAQLPDLKNAGVTSLKIEGRMKSPEYVAVVTGVYRKYLDRLKAYGDEEYRIDDNDLEKLAQIFNRGGFSTGYLKGIKSCRTLVYPVHPKNRGVRIGTVIDSKRDAVRVKLEKPLNMGDGIEVWDFKRGVPDIIVSSIVLNGEHVRHAPGRTSPWVGDMKVRAEIGSQVWRTYSKPLTLEARSPLKEARLSGCPLRHTSISRKECMLLCATDLMETGLKSDPGIRQQKRSIGLWKRRGSSGSFENRGYPYTVERVQVETDGISTLPISSLNAMRREAIGAISEIRRRAKIRGKVELKDLPPLSSPGIKRQEPDPALTAFFLTKPQLPAGYDRMVFRIYLPMMSKSELESIRETFRGEVFIWTPNIIREAELEDLLGALNDLKGIIHGVAAANPGTMQMLQKYRGIFSIHADYSMNLFNSWTLAMVEGWGASSASISPELRLDEAVRLDSRGMMLEAQVYGRVQLMTLEYCPSSVLGGCGLKCGDCDASMGLLRDRKRSCFPI